MEIRKIKLDTEYCYPCFPIIDGEDVFLGLRYTNSQADINSFDNCVLQKRNKATGEILWSYQLLESSLLCQPIINEENVFISTEIGIIAINKITGQQTWKQKVKIWNSHLSLVNEKIYLINKNSIEVLDQKTGNKENHKKYRVKWLDSPVVQHDNRLFISTSNSKILQLESSNLEILKEYKYPGGWAIAVTPQFFRDQLISNSYASYITSFDYESGETKWRIKKQVGSEPKQLILEKDQTFYAIEILGAHKLTAIDINKGKKIWSRGFHIHEIADFDSKTLIGTIKRDDGDYCIGFINKKEGKLTKSIVSEEFEFDDKFQYRLWKEATITQDNSSFYICYKPMELTVIDR